MSIVVRKDEANRVVPSLHFDKEDVIEELLETDFSKLLGLDETDLVQFVCRQLNLSTAGKADLFFVSGDGLPILVEVKRGVNPQSRREVVAQVIDYLSALSQLDVHELDARTQHRLESALTDLAADESELKTLWAALAGNLRTGKAKIVVVVDEAPPPDLVRICQFLAENSGLDMQLLKVQRFKDHEFEVFVPQILVDSSFQQKPRNVSPIQKRIEERLDDPNTPVAARDFFAKRLDRSRNSPGSALAYREAGKFRWYVEPTRHGARVTQIDRFDGDEETWRKRLSKPDNISRQKSKNRDNLRFDLSDPSDFNAFEDVVEKETHPPREWKKP